METIKPPDRLLRLVAYLVAFGLFLGIYLPRAGHGFIADDFEWALGNRSRSASDVAAILSRNNGFFRPVVGLTFAANEFLSGTDPRPYGMTNVALAALCALSILWLGRALRLPLHACAFAAAVWLLNFRGIDMAVLWLSGRTALLVTFAAAATMASLLQGHTVPACLWLTVALLSKEEAVLLPVTGALWLHILRPDRRRQLARWLVASLTITAMYLALRSRTGAMTPFDAPSYYQLTFDPRTLARNVVEYADRAFTFSVLITIIAFAVLRALPPRPLPPGLKAILAACAAWVAGSFAITIFLPVRSSLYVCLPSVGSALASAACVALAWDAATERRRRHALIAAILATLIVAPVHIARSRRWTSIAEFSTRAISDLQELTAGLPEGSEIVLYDARAVRGNRANLASAFGSLLNDGFYFRTGRRFAFRIEPAVADERPVQLPCDTCAAAGRVIDGRVVRIR
jgi:hypothetical protein